MNIHYESGLTDQFLSDLETRCLSDPKFLSGETILLLIAEVRRLKSLLPRQKKPRQKPPPQRSIEMQSDADTGRSVDSLHRSCEVRRLLRSP